MAGATNDDDISLPPSPSHSEPDLPSDCEDSDVPPALESGSEDSDVELPPGTDHPCKCSRQCSVRFPTGKLRESRKEVQQMSFHQRQQWQFDKVRMQFSHILGNDHGERRDPTPMAWTLMDIRDGLSVECEVCLPTWLRARCMGPGRQPL